MYAGWNREYSAPCAGCSVAQRLATAAEVAETRGGGAVSERLCSANRTVSGQ